MLPNVTNTMCGVLIAVAVAAIVGIAACLIVLRDFLARRRVSAAIAAGRRRIDGELESLEELSSDTQQFVLALLTSLDERVAQELQWSYAMARISVQSTNRTWDRYMQELAEPDVRAERLALAARAGFTRFDQFIAKARQELEAVRQRCEVLEELGVASRRASRMMDSLNSLMAFQQSGYQIPLEQLNQAGWLVGKTQQHLASEDLGTAKTFMDEAANLIDVLTGDLGGLLANSAEVFLQNPDGK